MSKAFAILTIYSFFICLYIQAELKKTGDLALPHYYCIASDERHYPLILNLIGSIHKVDFDALGEIAVFDLGLTKDQRNKIETIEKVKVYDIEMTHADLLTYFKTSPNGRYIRGWFAWKPVIIKQALDKFPYVLYLDAGTTVLNSPSNLFKQIQQNGYFLVNLLAHNIKDRITQTVVKKVVSTFSAAIQNDLMKEDTFSIDAGFQGVSRACYDSYVLPMYQFSSDLTLFEDDGSARMGFGEGRHDQILFTILAHVNHFNLNDHGWSELLVDGIKIPFHIHWNRADVNDQTCIYRSRWDFEYGGGHTQFIRWHSN